MALKATVNDREVRLSLGEAGKRLRLPAVHAIAGEVMRGSIKETFEQEGFPRNSWKKVSGSTVAAQFTRGGRRTSTPKRGRESAAFGKFRAGKKILTDSGRLQNSITYKSRGRSLVIGTNLIYARIHQKGGVIKAKPGKALRIPLGDGRVIFRKQVTIPARPFLLIKPKDPAAIGEALSAYTDGGGLTRAQLLLQALDLPQFLQRNSWNLQCNYCRFATERVEHY